MANQGDYTNQAMKNHEKTYQGFLALLKYSTIVIAVVLIGMAIFLVD